MKPIRLLSATEQVAAHLRHEILSGEISGEMAGIHQLAGRLLINHKTVSAALLLLEKEGLLVPQGNGLPRKIVISRSEPERRSLRVAILRYDTIEAIDRHSAELLHSLLHAGHAAFFSSKSQIELGMRLNRIVDHVMHTDADAWVVMSGSCQVLEWFANWNKPTFALFGRRQHLQIAGGGPNKAPAFTMATRRLIELGHRRIVLLTRRARRLPKPGIPETNFIKELEAHGIQVGPYNLPDWNDSETDFHEKLRTLFQSTPPTALIIDEASYFLATFQFLMNIGIRVPKDVSLICASGDPVFTCFEPSVSHIHWDTKPVISRVVRWVANIARDKQDLLQLNSKAEFIEGGTIGPVRQVKG